MLTTTATDVLFWIGTSFTLITFGIAVAQNFVNEKVYKILNWVLLGTSLVAAGCYMAYDILIGK